MLTKIVHLITTVLVVFFPYTCVSANANGKTYEVIVVGGGIAGLTAAYYLDDYDVLLLEKKKSIGGKATSGKFKNISYPRGPEYIGKPEGPLKEIVQELDLSVVEIPAPGDVIYRNKKIYFGDYGRAKLLVEKSSIRTLNRFVQNVLSIYEKYEDIPDLHFTKELERLDTITANQWFEENDFPPIYSSLYNVTFRGLFGASIDEISALSAIPEMAYDFEGFEQINEDNSLEEEFAGSRYSTEMYSIEGGISAIPDALGRDLGDGVQTGMQVTKITREGERFAVTCTFGNSQQVTHLTEAVILATPAPVSLLIANDVLNKEQRELLQSVHYAPYATVAMLSERPIFAQGFDLAVPEGRVFTDIYDATWISRKGREKNAIQNWVTLAYLAPQSSQEKTILSTKDEKIMETVLAQLNTIFPGASEKVKEYAITRFPFALPVMSPGSYNRMTRLHALTGDGLFLAGDYMIYPTFEAAAESGLLAAEEAIDWLED